MSDSHEDFAAIARLDANIDKLIEQRNVAMVLRDVAVVQRDAALREAENLRRELALATDRIEDLEAERDAATEREEPYA